MPNTLRIASALSLTATGPAASYRLGTTPLLGGQGREAILNLDSPVGGSGVVTIQGHPSVDKAAPAANDAGWYTVLTLDSTAALVQEIGDLPSWIRANVTTAGTGTLNLTLEGIQ